ncbi:MAG: hypothetical protein ACRDO7_04800 [Nocardioidaceae bacterium]
MSRRSKVGDALTDLVLPVFELNGEFLAAAEDICRPVGLRPARLVAGLGATLEEPASVSEVARRVGLGLARQSVQRVADLLVDEQWAETSTTPAIVARRCSARPPRARGAGRRA